MERDRKHLRWLALGHYVLGGLIALVCLLFLLSMIPGCAVSLFPKAHCTATGRCPRLFFGFFYNVIGLLGILSGLGMAYLLVLTGRCLSRTRRYRFCMVMAGVEGFLLLPLGTVLAIFTCAVLLRDSVAEQFKLTDAVSAPVKPIPGAPTGH